MKVTSLIKKLDKMNVTSEMERNEVKFVINNTTFFANCNSENVLFYYKENGYDVANREVYRIFYNNLNQVIRCAN